jgi:predicted RNA binding protein YcfA (HicA-like mRNA interferase family)
MPKKIRELKQILRKAGFTEIFGRGSHTNWTHPYYIGKLTVSGQDSADAKRYQEKDVSRWSQLNMKCFVGWAAAEITLRFPQHVFQTRPTTRISVNSCVLNNCTDLLKYGNPSG